MFRFSRLHSATGCFTAVGSLCLVGYLVTHELPKLIAPKTLEIGKAQTIKEPKVEVIETKQEKKVELKQNESSERVDLKKTTENKSNNASVKVTSKTTHKKPTVAIEKRNIPKTRRNDGGWSFWKTIGGGLWIFGGYSGFGI